MKKIEILSASSFLPKQIIKSVDLFDEIKSEQQYDISRDWMSVKMGIKERRIAKKGTQPSMLAVPAARKAIEQSSINTDDIGLVIFAGIERDYSEPATVHNIQNQLGLRAKYAFDVSNACFGFVDAIKIASNFINQGDVDYALICTGEVQSKVLHAAVDRLKKGLNIREARNIIGALSVGDAGGAVIIGKSENNKSGFDLFNYNSDSKHTEKCVYKIDENGLPDGVMHMAPITNAILKAHKGLIDDTYLKLKLDNFDWLLSHQMGLKPFKRFADITGVSMRKMIKTFDKLGNITSATFPVNFEKLVESGKVRKGEKISACFAGSGINRLIGYTF